MVPARGGPDRWAWKLGFSRHRGLSPRLTVAGMAVVLALVMVGDVLAAAAINSRRPALADRRAPALPALVAMFGPDGSPPSTSAPAPPHPAPPVGEAGVPSGPAPRPCTAPATVMVDRRTVVAHLATDTPGSAVPGGPAVGTVPGSWYGYPSVLPVIGRAPGWLEVREPQRPNGSTAWIPAPAATLSSTPWSLLVNLCTSRLLVFNAGRKVFDFPAGIGAPDEPTVTGNYFVTMTTPPPDPGYGPFVLATSAHSDAITDWEGTGDALIAIHGPITAYDDARIGTTGAAISHGCIRLHDADLARLAAVLPGSPLQIIGS